jgi:hypothetical protein
MRAANHPSSSGITYAISALRLDEIQIFTHSGTPPLMRFAGPDLQMTSSRRSSANRNKIVRTHAKVKPAASCVDNTTASQVKGGNQSFS